MSEILMQIRYDKRMCSSLTQTVSNMWSIVPGAGTVGCNYLSLPLMPASGTPLYIYEPWNMCISLGKGEWLTEYFDPQASPNSKIGRKIIKFPLIYWSVCLVGCVLKGGIYQIDIITLVSEKYFLLFISYRLTKDNDMIWFRIFVKDV